MERICYICKNKVTEEQLNNYQAIYNPDIKKYVHCTCKRWYALRLFKLERGHG